MRYDDVDRTPRRRQATVRPPREDGESGSPLLLWVGWKGGVMVDAMICVGWYGRMDGLMD